MSRLLCVNNYRACTNDPTCNLTVTLAAAATPCPHGRRGRSGALPGGSLLQSRAVFPCLSAGLFFLAWRGARLSGHCHVAPPGRRGLGGSDPARTRGRDPDVAANGGAGCAAVVRRARSVYLGSSASRGQRYTLAAQEPIPERALFRAADRGVLCSLARRGVFLES